MELECEKLRGTPASPGTAYGDFFIVADYAPAEIPVRNIGADAVEAEWQRFSSAVESAKQEIDALKTGGGKEQEEILEAQLFMLSDPEFLPLVKKELDEKCVNVEAALNNCVSAATAVLRASGDDFLAARATDIEDAFGRVMDKLLGIRRTGFLASGNTLQGKILAAKNLSPSDAVALRKSGVAAVLMEEGGASCHVAILARSWKIPAVVGITGLFDTLLALPQETPLLVDGHAGSVFVGVSRNDAEAYAAEQEARTAPHPGASADAAAGQPLLFETSDGVPFTLTANIALPEECAGVLESGAEGVGLFRSEFLFLQDGAFSLADEESQFEAYAAAAQALNGLPLTVRTLDVGGDKALPVQAALKEKNPLLGWRAIRFCLDEKNVFRTQLRAILRASIFGNVRVMFPMVATVSELDAALAALEEAKESCRRDGLAFDAEIKTGVMIEIPAAAVCADLLARRVSFLSIGSNDLVQYTLAADRENSKVSYLSTCYDPAVLRLIRHTVKAGETHGAEVSLCGEMACSPAAACLLFGMGLRKFSMSPAFVAEVAHTLSSLPSYKMEEIAELVLAAETAAETQSVLERELGKLSAGKQ